MQLFKLFFFVLVLNGALITQTPKNEPYQNYFIPNSNISNYPSAFAKLDSLLGIFYQTEAPKLCRSQKFLPYFRNLPDSELLKWRDVLLDVRNSPPQVFGEYLSKINIPFEEQYRLKRSPTVPKPIWIIIRLSEQIYGRFGWEWEFYIKTVYMVVGKVTNFKLGAPGTRKNSIPYYGFTVLQDLKGNYSENMHTNLVGNLIVGKMDVGKKYLVLITEKDMVDNVYQNAFLLRGLATNNIAFFPIEDGYIIDEKRVLNFSTNRIKVSGFQTAMKLFYTEQKGWIQK
jgi:hypothetical protein